MFENSFLYLEGNIDFYYPLTGNSDEYESSIALMQINLTPKSHSER